MDKDLLTRFQKAVEAMTNPNPEEVDGTQEVTVEGCVAYLVDQVEKAAADAPETRQARLAHVLEVIEVAKNYEGPTPGALRIPTFKDPGQQTTTTTTTQVNPQNAPINTAMTANNPDQPAGTPTTPAGGQLPPMSAGGSGYTTEFSKAMDTLQKAIASLGADETETAPKTPGASAETAPTAPVKKSAVPTWPLDMNTPFGRGETDDDVTPEWGFDVAEETQAAE